eukprot:6031713-Pyramimonas_sp.AAC.1
MSYSMSKCSRSRGCVHLWWMASMMARADSLRISAAHALAAELFHEPSGLTPINGGRQPMLCVVG